MELQFLRREAMDTLRKGIGENIIRYAEEKEDWTDSFFLEKGTKMPLFSSEIIAPDVELVLGKDAANDVENAILIHKAFKDVLNPVQAADRRLWIALTHTVFYTYMTSRWPVENETNNSGTNGTITDRYFASRGLFRNGLSRLFWIAELTYDSSLEDTYEYTRFLMNYQDLINQVDGSSLCRNKAVLKAYLKALKKAGEMTERQKRLFFNGMCNKGGVRVLDALPQDVMDDLCENVMEGVLDTKQIENGSKVSLRALESGQDFSISVQAGKAYSGKTLLISRPTNLYRLTIGDDLELGKTKYKIIDIQ
jgi:hypothetical protein